MAISYVGGVAGGRAGATTTTTQSLSGTLTGGLASSPSPGDLVVVWCSVGADTTAPGNQTISGNNNGAYSNETQQSQLGTTYDAYSMLNWKVQGSTVDTSITIPSSGSARNAQRWAVHVFRGVDSTTPWDTTSTTASGTASGRPNPPSITPSTSGAWILWLGSSSAATGTAYTAPTNFATNWRGGTTADTADCMDGFGYYTGWSSGAYDPAAITAGGTTNAADAWVAKTAVLRPQGATTHSTSGILSADSASIVGSSARTRDHSISGALSAGSATIVGSASRSTIITHSTTGVLSGDSSNLVGSASRTREHSTTSVLSAGSATVVGSSARTHVHPTTGVLSGGSATIVGSADSKTIRTSTGALTGPGSTVVSSATRYRLYSTTGALNGPGSIVVGSASRSTSTVTHDTTGVLSAGSATIAGSADSKTVRTSSSDLIAGSAIVVGSSSRTRAHSSTGVLSAGFATIAASAEHSIPAVTHDTSGVLSSNGTTINGESAINRTHLSSGELFGLNPIVVGIASNSLEYRSGVNRLWMYELYANSIEEDRKKREEKIEKKPAAPVLRFKTAKSSKKATQNRPKAKPQPTATPKPLPPIVRATPQGPSYIDFVEKLIEELPVLNTNIIPIRKFTSSKPAAKIEDKVKKQKKHEEEWLLMLAA